MSDALAHFQLLLADVDNLIEHHPKFVEPLPGRPTSDEGPLLRSCIVLTYAAWEVYFEDSLIEASLILSRGERSDLPQATLDYVAKKSRETPWSLADAGWRNELVRIVTERVRGTPNNASSFGVNTAGPGIVNSLLDEILGVRTLNQCAWKGAKSDTVKSKLSALVKLRGDIAHGGRPRRR